MVAVNSSKNKCQVTISINEKANFRLRKINNEYNSNENYE